MILSAGFITMPSEYGYAVMRSGEREPLFHVTKTLYDKEDARIICPAIKDTSATTTLVFDVLDPDDSFSLMLSGNAFFDNKYTGNVFTIKTNSAVISECNMLYNQYEPILEAKQLQMSRIHNADIKVGSNRYSNLKLDEIQNVRIESYGGDIQLAHINSRDDEDIATLYLSSESVLINNVGITDYTAQNRGGMRGVLTLEGDRFEIDRVELDIIDDVEITSSGNFKMRGVNSNANNRVRFGDKAGENQFTRCKFDGNVDISLNSKNDLIFENNIHIIGNFTLRTEGANRSIIREFKLSAPKIDIGKYINAQYSKIASKNEFSVDGGLDMSYSKISFKNVRNAGLLNIQGVAAKKLSLENTGDCEIYFKSSAVSLTKFEDCVIRSDEIGDISITFAGVNKVQGCLFSGSKTDVYFENSDIKDTEFSSCGGELMMASVENSKISRRTTITDSNIICCEIADSSISDANSCVCSQIVDSNISKVKDIITATIANETIEDYDKTIDGTRDNNKITNDEVRLTDRNIGVEL